MAFINLERFKPRERVLLGVGCLAILLVFGNWAVARRLYGKLEELSMEIESKSECIEKNYAVIAKTNEVKAKYDSMQSYFPKPPAMTSDSLSTMVEQMAASCGVSLLDRKPQDSTKKGSFQEYCVKFEMAAEQDGLVRLLHRMETSPQLLRVSRLVISRNTRAGAPPLKAEMFVTAIAQLSEGS